MKEQIKKYIIDTFMYGEGSVEDDEQLFELWDEKPNSLYQCPGRLNPETPTRFYADRTFGCDCDHRPAAQCAAAVAQKGKAVDPDGNL